jgi:tRNA synthetases class I (I, L, M and V)
LRVLDEFNEWCISEDSIWGIPIPYFVRKDTQEVLCDPEIVSHVSALFRQHAGSDCWYSLSLLDLLPKRYHGQAPQLEKGTQVFDVWFDNALSWQFALTNDFHDANPLSVALETQLRQLQPGTFPEVAEPTKLLGPGGKVKANSMKEYMASKRKQKQMPNREQEESAAVPVSEVERNLAKIFPKEMLQALDEK